MLKVQFSGVIVSDSIAERLSCLPQLSKPSTPAGFHRLHGGRPCLHHCRLILLHNQAYPLATSQYEQAGSGTSPPDNSLLAPCSNSPVADLSL